MTNSIAENDSAQDQGRHRILLVGLSIVVLIWYIAMWSVGLLGCWTARKRYRSRPNPTPSLVPTTLPSSAPGVSILRPLKGLDANLSENLESSFKQDYPNFEILLSVADEHDKALPIVHGLLEKYPNVNARVIIGEEQVGVNPKVNNLMRSYNEAAHDILWVLDSNVAVVPGALARAVDILSRPSSHPNPSWRRIALVHHVPFAISSRATFGARLEEAFLNTNHAKMYIAVNAAAVDSCVMGKSNLFRRSDLERLDGSLVRQQYHDSRQGLGLAMFARFLAEDNMIGLALWHELDLRHDLSYDVAYNALGDMRFSDYVWRRVRWIRVRKPITLVATSLEPFTESVMLGAIVATTMRYLIGMPIQLFLPVHFLLWTLVDLDVYASLAGYSLPSSKRWSFLVAWLVRELLAFPIWILGIIGNEVEWRGRRYKVLQNGEAERVPM
ncbi:glycosyltransferase family 21 protein [Multifurca ochricompacta]|uniref:Ceramide glucosyltransferase n=1 Tax=Multifurca ochricompacta TaxID=376703 RepID=A0AAD4MC63_9AGAM|nr:glycosyltransferase family 21 protein [Multifurca ochricompacta]